MWKSVLLIGYLVVLGVYDIRKRAVPGVLLAVGMAVAVGISVWELGWEERQTMECMVSLLPGAFLLAVSWITGQVGSGDGILLLILGLALGWTECIFIFFISLFLASIVSVVLLLFHKVKRNARIPFIPFMTAASLIRALLM